MEAEKKTFTIDAFMIDHENHAAGIYLSRKDGDVFTYDVRICKPYADPLLTNAQMHSLEHLLATILRCGSDGDKVVYVGPMGCQTGFYVLLRDVPPETAKSLIIAAFNAVRDYRGDVPGATKVECGNYKNLSVAAAAEVAELFLGRILLKN